MDIKPNQVEQALQKIKSSDQLVELNEERGYWESISQDLDQNTGQLHLNEGLIQNEAHTQKQNLPTESQVLQPYKDDPAMQWLKGVVSITSLSPENEKVEWIWDGFLAKGYLTLLSAFWKAGKTTFICHFLASMQKEQDLCDKKTLPVNVLIITEESKGKWGGRREEFQLVDGIWLWCRPIKKKLNNQEWVGLLEEVAGFCQKNDIQLVIIDTLTTFWPVRDENNASEMAAALLPLNGLLEAKLGVLLVHHLRKGDGQEGTASRGSGALPSTTDIMMEFRRFDPSRVEDQQRVLTCYSRFDETPHEIVLELTDGGYITRGTRQQVTKRVRMDVLLRILPIAPTGWSIQQVVANWPEDESKVPDDSTIFRWLKQLESQGEVGVIGKSADKGQAEIWGRMIALQP